MSSPMVPIHEGWNVWSVYQKNDLDIEPMMVGVNRDRRLRIWVEEKAESASGVDVSDQLSLRGSQVQILLGVSGLTIESTREQLPGDLLLLDGPATLRYVRFFNRGARTETPWPHDSNYLLESVYQPSATSPITTGPPPAKLSEPLTRGAINVAEDIAKIGLAILIGYVAFEVIRSKVAGKERSSK